MDLSKTFKQRPGLSQKAIFLDFAAQRAIHFISRLIGHIFQMLSTLISFLLKILPLPPQTTNTPPCSEACVDMSLKLHNGSQEKSKCGEAGSHEDNMNTVPFSLLYKAGQQAQWTGQESRVDWTE